MNIEKIKVKNFKIFNDATFDRLGQVGVLVGPNGSGKSTFFDLFAFLKDALTHNGSVAFNRRGGFQEVISRGKAGTVDFEIQFQEDSGLVAKYELILGWENGRAVVERENLKFCPEKENSFLPLLEFTRGKGTVRIYEENSSRQIEENFEEEKHELDSSDILAIKGLGQFQRFPVIRAFRKMVEGFHFSDFQPASARELKENAPAEHLSEQGENLALVAKFLYQNYPEIFSTVLQKMSSRIPGLESIEAKLTEDGRILLRFKDGSFKEAFTARFVSDGTLKMLAYLLLLYTPQAHNLLCVEEPETRLYPLFMAELTEEFKSYGERGGQVFITTHSPDFLNGVELEEIYWLEKKEGFSVVHRAADDPMLTNLIAEGDKPGYLWKQKLFGKTNLP